MQSDSTSRFAAIIVIASGALWGFYWLPVRSLSELGLPGAWGTAAITTAASLILLPIAFKQRKRLGRTSPLGLASVALGGAAFALYSIGFIYGRVAIIILLFFLTPVWSTLIGRFVMGWPTPRMRLFAIILGLIGLGVMLGTEGEFPMPRGIGEWLALLSGLLWSIATTGIRAKPELQPTEAAFVFALGATAAALLLAPILQPWQGPVSTLWPVIGLATVTGAVWWGLSMAALMWATARLDPARVGILLMAEVIVGLASAAIFAGEHLHIVEIIGGAFVICAAVLEVWPVRPRQKE